MAFNVTGLTAWTDEVSQELIKKAVYVGKTLNRVDIMIGNKGVTAINLLENTVTIADASCGFTPAGTVAFTQRDVTVAACEVKDTVCPKTLEKYWMGELMKSGAATDVDAIMPILGESYVEKVQEAIELQIWSGDTGGTDKIDGWATLLASEATRVVASCGTPDIFDSDPTASTIISMVDCMVLNIPEAILSKTDLVLNLSLADYMMYTGALRTANLFHYNGDNGSDYETFIPGTNVKVVGVHGLTGTHKWILASNANLVYSTDLMGEDEMFNIWYSQDNDEVRVNIQWKMGVNVKFPAEIVTNF